MAQNMCEYAEINLKTSLKKLKMLQILEKNALICVSRFMPCYESGSQHLISDIKVVDSMFSLFGTIFFEIRTLKT